MVHTKRRNRLKQKMMNDVVFVIDWPRSHLKKTVEYDIDDLDLDEEWIVEDEEGLDSIKDLDILDDLNLALEGDDGRGSGPSNDLEIPYLDDDDFDDLHQREGNENGGNHIEDDEYDDHNPMDLL